MEEREIIQVPFPATILQGIEKNYYQRIWNVNNRKIPRELKITEQFERNLNLFEVAEGMESIKEQKERKQDLKNTNQAHYKT